MIFPHWIGPCSGFGTRRTRLQGIATSRRRLPACCGRVRFCTARACQCRRRSGTSGSAGSPTTSMDSFPVARDVDLSSVGQLQTSIRHHPFALGERVHRELQRAAARRASERRDLPTPRRKPRFSSKPGGAITTPSAHTEAWDTGRRPRKRSFRQAGQPTPLRSAVHPAWPRNRLRASIRTGAVREGRSTRAGLGVLSCLQAPSTFECGKMNS